MTITCATERGGYVSYSSESALRRAVTHFVEHADGERMVLDARISWADIDDDTTPLTEIDRHAVCTTAPQAWAEVSVLLDRGGHLELEVPPQRSDETDEEEIAA